MKRSNRIAAIAVWSLLLMTLPDGTTAADPAEAAATTGAVRVMTFNIRYNTPSDGENAWPHRRDWVADVIRRSGADLVGCQEVQKDQLDDLAARLPDFMWYGVGRDDGRERGEFVPVFIRNERFDVLARDTFWLSETPDRAGSRGWDASLPRTTTVLRLKDRQTGRTLSMFNTHFDHRGETARRESARLLLEQIAQRREEGDLVVVTGDFNCTPDSRPYRILTGTAGVTDDDDAADNRSQDRGMPNLVLRDARDISQTKFVGPDSTWNGFERVVPGRRIDFIFVAGQAEVRSHRTLDESRDGRFPSDHLPVLVDVTLD